MQGFSKLIRVLGACALPGLVALPASAQVAEPMRVRNASPVVAIFGLPHWEAPAAGANGEVAVVVEAANHHRFSRRGAQEVSIDGETWRTSLSYRRRLGQRWWAGVDAPHYRLSGGVLDGLIDRWHSLFALPDGGRDARERGQLVVALEDPAGTFVALERRRSGAGDVQLAAARVLGRHGSLLLRASAKLPTGEEPMLAGSGAVDASLTLLQRRAVSFRDRPAGFYWGVGAARLGRPRLVRYAARDWAYLAVLGGGWQLGPRGGLKVQVDLHSAPYRSPLKELGRTAVQGTLGGWWSVGARTRIELGMSEDLVVGASPDFALHAALHWRL